MDERGYAYLIGWSTDFSRPGQASTDCSVVLRRYSPATRQLAATPLPHPTLYSVHPLNPHSFGLPPTWIPVFLLTILRTAHIRPNFRGWLFSWNYDEQLIHGRRCSLFEENFFLSYWNLDNVRVMTSNDNTIMENVMIVGFFFGGGGLVFQLPL